MMTTTLPTPAALPQFPWLPPILRRVWRAPEVLQIGIDNSRAVVLSNVTKEMADFITSLDGHRPLAEVIAHPTLDEASATAVLHALCNAGLLIDLAAANTTTDVVSPGSAIAQFTPEVHGRALGRHEVSVADTIRRRCEAHVVVAGGSRLALAMSALLAASGIERLGLISPGRVSPTDLIPGGPGHDDLGKQRVDAVREAVDRASRTATVTPLGATDEPDLVVLTEPADPHSERVRMLMRTQTPFVGATLRERRGVVGPFVIPGQSSCLECQDAVRRDLDGHWAVISQQLIGREARPSDGGETALVMMTASLATTQVLQWLDRERLPETINATLEIALPDLLLERRYWPRHEACSCRVQ